MSCCYWNVLNIRVTTVTGPHVSPLRHILFLIYIDVIIKIAEGSLFIELHDIYSQVHYVYFIYI